MFDDANTGQYIATYSFLDKDDGCTLSLHILFIYAHNNTRQILPLNSLKSLISHSFTAIHHFIKTTLAAVTILTIGDIDKYVGYNAGTLHHLSGGHTRYYYYVGT